MTTYASTKALSVYNAIIYQRFVPSLTPQHVLWFLREHWDAAYKAEDVTEGLRFLFTNGFVKEENGSLRAAYRKPDGQSLKLRRCNEDRDLEIAT